MTDTKHEVPEIDWSKPVEAFVDDEWYEVTHSVRNNDGSLYVDDDGEIDVCGPEISAWIEPYNIRNKPEPLEVWVNVYPGDTVMGAHKSKDAADRLAGSIRIRCARMVEAPDQ